MSERVQKTWTPARETAEQWMERIGWCGHVPRCHDSDKCRQKRAEEREQREAARIRPFGCETPKKNKRLDFD